MKNIDRNFTLKLKDSVSLEQLREYGFKPGKEWLGHERLICNNWQYDSYYYFKTEYENPNSVLKSEETEHPLVSMEVDKEHRTIYIEAEPDCTYNVTSIDIAEVLNIIALMVKDGLIEV